MTSSLSPTPPSPAPDRRVTFDAIVDRASGRYRAAGITQWQVARGKLRGDPVFRAVWDGPWTAGRTVVDLGCGQGLMLALFASARESADGVAPGESEIPRRLIGVEMRARSAEIARVALQAHAEIVTGDAREFTLPSCETVFIFDVLHVLPAADQDALLARIARALAPGGTLLLREADAAAGWRFQCVQISNRFRAMLGGGRYHHCHFRSAEGWRELLRRHGFTVAVHPMGRGTPFGNVLFAATKPARGI
ncbi:MAG TPA: class I SAM-dependent methyltransferase [Opitutaceae bacterium]|nr:class I SAM-dependent methyltransferase [Opitutaceae bacterium]